MSEDEKLDEGALEGIIIQLCEIVKLQQEQLINLEFFSTRPYIFKKGGYPK